MPGRKFSKWAKPPLAAAMAVTMAGCMTFQPLEPKISPPSNFQLDATVPIEFVHPAKIGFRCAERGAKFLGMPGINSGACADETLMTMPNPCYTITGGWYAEMLCHELGHVNGWQANHAGGSLRRQEPMLLASQSPQALAARNKPPSQQALDLPPRPPEELASYLATVADLPVFEISDTVLAHNQLMPHERVSTVASFAMASTGANEQAWTSSLEIGFEPPAKPSPARPPTL